MHNKTIQNAWQDFQPLFRPNSIAVVGASENAGPGLQVLENLEQLGYTGKIFPVNPKYDTIKGMRCYPSLSAIGEAGEKVDMLAILLGHNHVLPLIEEAASIGVKAAWAFASGFGESGEAGREAEARLKSLCAQNGISFLGPNCVGFLNPSVGVGTYSAPAPVEIKRGHIGMVAQSGYLSIAMANSARGLGYSLIASTGNESVVDSTDCMAYMLEDPETDVIMAFIEQFRHPDKLRAVAARALELGKPIILIKVGRSAMAQRATCAHTGALAGSDAVQDALYKKLGIIRVDSPDEMFETAELFACMKDRLPSGNGIFAITLSGGVISLMADLGEGLNLRFPEWSKQGAQKVNDLLMPYSSANNPLDAWGSGKIADTYEPCVLAAADESESGIVLIVQDVPPGMAPRQVDQYAIVARAAVAAAKKTSKPIAMLCNTSTCFHPDILAILREGNVPLLQGTSEGLKAVDHFIEYAQVKRTAVADDYIKGTFPQVHGGGNKGLTEYESKKALAAYGIPCTKEILCADIESCINAAGQIGYPVVLKVMSPAILHKTEAGIIAVGLKDADAIRKAYDPLMQKAKAFAPGAPIDGMLVQQMAGTPVAEIIIGITRDPGFGPAVVFGSGGILVEILKDSALGIPPFTKAEALSMIQSTKGYRLLTGFRGRAKADIDALADVLVRVSHLAADGADKVEALDINPLLVYPEGQGVLAVDALLELRSK
ncbi:MAG: acetate--CoA ligase family protein [Clostridia bacterium]